MSLAKDLLKAIDNPYAAIAADGLLNDSNTFIDTGCYALNAVMSGSIYGGLPTNKIFALGGDPSTGKTFFALSIAKFFQETHEDATVFYFDSEAAIDTNIIESRKLDPSRFAHVGVATIEDFKTQALQLAQAYKKRKDKTPVLFVLDSLGNLSTKKETGDTVDGKDVRDMTKAQLNKAAFRVLTLELAYLGIPMIVTNHIYNMVGAYIPTKELSGGSGLKYAASVILALSKAKAKGKDAGGKSTDTDRIGSIITVNAQKSRLIKEETKVKVLLRHTGGLDKYFGLFDLAKEAGLVVKEGNRWKNTLTDVVWFAKDILAPKTAPDFYTKEMLDAIEEHVKETFHYGDLDEMDIEYDEFDNPIDDDDGGDE